MVAAISSEAASTDPLSSKASSRQPEEQHNPSRPPLLPSEKDNGTTIMPLPRRPKGRQVSSRYMSPSPSTSSFTSTSTSTSTSSSSSSRRFPSPSPLLSRSTNSNSATPSTPLPSSLPKRSQSVDRRRPATPRAITHLPDSRQDNAGDVSAATKLLVTSTRSLSVSFQGEAFSLPISKTKAAAATPASTNARKAVATPERRKSTPVRGKGGDQGENSRPMEQHRWPGRTRQPNSGSNHLSRSADCSGDKKNLIGNGFGKVVRALQRSMMDDGRRVSFDGGLSLDLGRAELLKAAQQYPHGNSVNESSLPSDLTASDTDSVSSGSTSGAQDCVGAAKGRSGSRGLAVSARFWQETNSRLRRLQDPGSPLSTSPGSRISVPTKFTQLKRYNSDGPVLSPRTVASPIRGTARPASPSKLRASAASSPSRGVTSPARVRSAVASSVNSNSNSTPSILSFSADVRRGKIGEDRIFDAHTLRLLYNRYVQWRFVNARADATFMVQKMNAERHLWNAWVTTSELRHSVILKRIKLLLLRQKLKLTSILKGQISSLEEWALLDRDHSSSLLGATEALRASTLRLPVVEKAIADVSNLKDALGSAADVMQAMASSIYSLLSKVEETNSLVAELVKVTAKERFLLEQCKEFLSSSAAMQVKDCSLRTHILQLCHVPTTRSLTTRV